MGSVPNGMDLVLLGAKIPLVLVSRLGHQTVILGAAFSNSGLSALEAFGDPVVGDPSEQGVVKARQVASGGVAGAEGPEGDHLLHRPFEA